MKSKPLILPLDEFLEQELGNQRFLVKPLLPMGGIGLLTGKRGHGKTQLAVTLMKDLVNGEKFLGRFETGYSRVAYLSLDLPMQMLQSRLEAAKSSFSQPDSMLVVGFDQPIEIRDIRAAHDWVQVVNEFEPDLIVLDTLRKMHRMDENVNAASIIFYSCLKELFGGEVTFLIAHHDRKDNKETRGAPEEEKTAGTGGWVDNSDLCIHVRKVGSKVKVTFPRQRFCSDDDPILSMVECGFDAESVLLKPLPKKPHVASVTSLDMKVPEANVEPRGLTGGV